MGRCHAHGADAGAPDCDVEWACGMVLSMKPIQVTFDEELLAELDERPEVRERGRSAVLREATVAYLAKRRTEDIARQYEEALHAGAAERGGGRGVGGRAGLGGGVARGPAPG